MKKTKKKKIRIPLPKQACKVQDTDLTKYNRKRETAAQNIMRNMGWTE